jgi:hypothetical protein
VLAAREEEVKRRLQEEADFGMAKRLSHELNSSRLATKADEVGLEDGRDEGLEGVGLKLGELLD